MDPPLRPVPSPYLPGLCYSRVWRPATHQLSPLSSLAQIANSISKFMCAIGSQRLSPRPPFPSGFSDRKHMKRSETSRSVLEAQAAQLVVTVDYGISRVLAAQAYSSGTDDGAVTTSLPDLPLRCIITWSIV
ncbi:hypothetical protein GE21DRAFT_863 [Neurospora crassa]|uniref:Uncharacterized protein n=1 Tax=Neurospora crassa (strain ATCC 24698 / 74-OR23-1A / CBS 708.71 / DSM 1257 / FGSC 987) TaxID=367110 RepID=Q7SH57_NEUCR|nr:hypothetical protein NCU02672 [Neurospora crassa OR74A]EAA36209.2 hypothetical protein NCU02672 [Neurospora crassa OR74A]KHE90117.1 hypothetical protein GE21DRAFT_863 [Neurospora crassa]|eukprot:XP_965445.2 hypothetical protein NCU02672 [Neurospora crassa OR74A]